MTRILIVEDDLPTARLLSAAIVMSIPNCLIEAVGDGDQAMSLLTQRRFKVIITDNFHDGASGLEILRRIRSDPKQQGMKVMIVSGHAYGKLAQDAWRHGADCVFSKPFEIQKFQRNFNRLVGGPI